MAHSYHVNPDGFTRGCSAASSPDGLAELQNVLRLLAEVGKTVCRGSLPSSFSHIEQFGDHPPCLADVRMRTSAMWPILHDIAGRTKVVYWQYMSIMLNHTIVAAKDKKESADFLTELFGLPDAQAFGHFLAVNVANDVSLDYAEVPDGEEIRPQHYAFLVSEDEFDSIYGKIRDRGIQHWADPRAKQTERDQPQRRRPWRLLPGSVRSLP